MKPQTPPPSEEARELLACPFCGGEARLTQNHSYRTGEPLEDDWYVICPPCDLICDRAWGKPRDEVITAWNTRASLSPKSPSRENDEGMGL